MHNESSWARLLRDRVITKRRIIQYNVYSSLWSSIKDEYDVILSNSVWLLGNGKDINFWSDSWCGRPLVEQFNIPH
jgi:hypothetical protein